jgi:hypothetical protein
MDPTVAQLMLAVLSGGIVALLLTVFGGGGSVLAVPLLLYVVGVQDPHVAIGASAAGVALNALTALTGQARAGPGGQGRARPRQWQPGGGWPACHWPALELAVAGRRATVEVYSGPSTRSWPNLRLISLRSSLADPATNVQTPSPRASVHKYLRPIPLQ